MNKMSYLEATLPAGENCLFPSELEAREHFSKFGLFGKIMLGVGTTNRLERLLVWLLQTADNQSFPLQVFASEQPVLGEITFFHQETEGNYIYANQHNYLICQDEVLGLVIRELAIFANECDIKAFRMIKQEPFSEISLVRVYEKEPRLRFLFVSWFIELPEHKAELKPAFIEDVFIHRGFNPQNVTWEFMGAGETFTHFSEPFQVDFDNKSGWYFNKVFINPHLKLLKAI